MVQRSFESLWKELEPHVLSDRRIIARAILALAVDFREERDDPKFHDKLRRDRTLDAEAKLEDMPTPEDIEVRKEAIRKSWTEIEKRHRLGRTGPPEPVMPPVSSPTTVRKSKESIPD